jgi:uncharacterized membrane protein
MQKTTLPWVVLVLLVGFAAWHIAHYAPLLPETVASHFGDGGYANDYTSKASFLRFYAVLYAVLVVTFGGLALVIPKIPPSFVNLPHKEHYLTPEHRAASMGYIGSFLLWFGNATLAFFIATMHLTFEANLIPEPRLGATFFVLLGVYMVGSLAATVVLLLRFRRPV